MSSEKNAGRDSGEGATGKNDKRPANSSPTTPAEQLAAVAACLFEPRDIVEVRRFRFAGGRLAVVRNGSTWHTAAELPELAETLAADNAEGVSAHVGVNPRSRHGGTKAADVAIARCLIADFDGGAAVDDALRRIGEAGLPVPTLTIASGHGAHCYWRLSRPIALELWTQWQKDLIAALASDPNIFDAPRVMRLPGGTNWKPPAAPCRLVDADPARVYDLSQLGAPILAALPEPATSEQTEAPRTAQPTQSAKLDAIGRATLHAARWESVVEGERNPAAFRRAAELVRDFGLAEADAWPILARWNASNSPPLPERELRDCLKSARKHGKHERGAKLDADRPVPARGAAKGKPTPPRTPAPKWRPFPVDQLPPTMRDFVTAVSRATSMDTSYAALACLVTAAGCIGNRAAALVKGGWTEPAVLFGALVGRSGQTKSPVLKLCKRPLVELYKLDRQRYAEALAAFAIELDRHEAAMKTWRDRGCNGEPPEAPAPPVERRVLIVDTTPEKLAVVLQDNPHGLLLVRDELAGLVGGFDRYTSAKGAEQAAWLSIYDAGEIIVDRKTTKGAFVDRAAVSVLGTIQPATLARVFGAAERESGLLARFLLAWPPDRAPEWTGDDLPDDVAAKWRDLLADLLDLPGDVDEHGDPKPQFLPIAAEAMPLWIPWHDQHAIDTHDCPGDDLNAAFAKLKGGCIRIALVLACVEAVATGRGVRCIDAVAMRRATAITDWFKNEAGRVYAAADETSEEADQRRLVAIIQRKGGRITARQLQRTGKQYATAEAAELALHALVRAELVVVEHEATGGHPLTWYVLVDKSPPEAPVDTDESCENPETNDTSGSVDACVIPEIAPDPEAAPEADAGQEVCEWEA